MSKSRIVAVDDEDLVLELLQVSLESWAEERQVEVLTCRSGAQALALLEEGAGTVCIVLSDLRMPGMSGTELLGAVSRRYPGIITILVTGHADVRDLAAAVQSGIFSFIIKPWKTDYLEGELDKALRVHALREENRRFLAVIAEELHWAGELQRALLTLDLPSSIHMTFAVTSLPLPRFECGGDYHDVVDLGTERALFMVGDVAGHGVKAAFLTFFLRAAIRQGYLAATAASTPSGLLRWLNRLLCEELAELPGSFVSFCVCLLDTASSTLTSSSAGHQPLFVVRDGRAISLGGGGTGVGFDPGSAYADSSFDVRAGDRIVLHTDGLRELGPNTLVDDELFGQILADASGASDFHGATLSRVRALAGEKGFTDDVTLLTALLH